MYVLLILESTALPVYYAALGAPISKMDKVWREILANLYKFTVASSKAMLRALAPALRIKRIAQAVTQEGKEQHNQR